jgi:HD-like signal output (HDOD) protein
MLRSGPKVALLNFSSSGFEATARERRKQRIMSLVAKGFPVPSGRLFELLGRLSDPVVDLGGVSKLIRSQPRLNGQILGLLGTSPCEEYREPLGVEDAVLLLGSERLRILIFGCALADFAGRRLPADWMRAFWQHSILTALLSARIARESQPEIVEKAHLGGLLHDIGCLPLLIVAHEQQVIGAKIPQGLDEHPDLESSYFGVTHCEVGRWIAICGNFSPWMTELIEHHHSPGEACEEPALTAIVAAAERHCQAPVRRSLMDDDLTASSGEVLSLMRPAGLLEHNRAAQSQFLENSDHSSAFPRFGSC